MRVPHIYLKPFSFYSAGIAILLFLLSQFYLRVHWTNGGYNLSKEAWLSYLGIQLYHVSDRDVGWRIDDIISNLSYGVSVVNIIALSLLVLFALFISKVPSPDEISGRQDGAVKP